MLPSHLPEGFRPLVLPFAEDAPLRLALLCRSTPDPIGGYLVSLGRLGEGDALLGAWVDSHLQLYRYVEVLARPVDAFATDLNERREQAWRQLGEAIAELEPGGVLPALTCPPCLLKLDSAQAEVLSSDGATWSLCRDDALLAEEGLPPYSRSGARYLYRATAGPASEFVPLGAEAPRAHATRVWEAIFPTAPTTRIFNAEGAPLIIREAGALPLETFARMLSGESWPGYDPAKTPLLPPALREQREEPLSARHGTGYFIYGSSEPPQRLREIFYLKLQLLADCFVAARRLVERTGRPLFHLGPQSLRVRLGETAEHLPWFWSFQVQVALPVTSLEVPVPTSETRYFTCHDRTVSVYRPEQLGRFVRGEGSLRIRECHPETERGVVFEGSLTLQEAVTPSASELMRLWVPLADGEAEFFSEVSLDAFRSQGEVRIVTLPTRLAPPVAQALKAAEGVPLSHVRYELHPPLRTPCDVYSLGVLGVNLLCVTPDTSLPAAVDGVMSLGRRAGELPEGSASARTLSLLQTDPHWLSAIGPSGLLGKMEQKAIAREAIPHDLWARALSLLARCFPGLSRDSFHRDLGDVASASLLELAFDPALRELQTLLVSARQCLLHEEPGNATVRATLQRLRQVV